VSRSEIPDRRKQARIRAAYDSIAHRYAVKYSGELEHKPLDRELLMRFRSEVGTKGLVYDLGCGPGQTTRFLKDAGLSVRGLDLSPKLVFEAKMRHRDIEFVVGDMLALPIRDASLAGIVSFYGIVHFSPDELRTALSEMNRVLVDGGRLLIAFHAGTRLLHVDELLGKPVSLDFEFFDPIDVAAELAIANFAEIEVKEREPYPGVEFPSRRAYLMARKYAIPQP
jgi:SAM-dependent methyltransferase